MKKLAEEDIQAILVMMPFNLAVFGINGRRGNERYERNEAGQFNYCVEYDGR